MASGCGAFVDRQVVLRTLVSRAEKISEGLRAKDIEKYRSLIDWFHRSDGSAASEDEFQKDFRTFYAFNNAGLTPDFIAAYFRLMGTLPRRTDVDLAEICKALQRYKTRKGIESLQFAFCTKLAATLNPDYPIYDACVAMVFQFAPPSPPMPYEGRVRCCLNFYNDCLWPTIKWLASSRGIVKMNETLLAKLPGWSGLSATKQIDFLIWTAGKLLLAEKRKK